MTRERRSTKGRFLSQLLSKSKISFIRSQFPIWYNKEKKRNNLPGEMNEEVLREFFDFMGPKDDSF